MRISVCMATRNGSAFVERQLRSILDQTRPPDEIIVVDDASTDDTVAVIRSLADPRIVIVQNEARRGVSASFTIALARSTGDTIFLSDQDDWWYPQKIACLMPLLSDGVGLVVHDAQVVDPAGRILHRSLFAARGSRAGFLRNFASNSYTGCCMAFRRKVLTDVGVVPTGRGICHDSWIGLMAETAGHGVRFFPEKLIRFQRHDGNASSLRRRSLVPIMLDRVALALALLRRLVSRAAQRAASTPWVIRHEARG